MMTFDTGIHHRRSIRLKDYDYSEEGAYFITICTKNRECIFGDVVDGEMVLNKYGEIVKKCWCNLPGHFKNISLDEFIIMPNHFHGIVIIDDCDKFHVGAIHELPLQTNMLVRRKMLIPKLIGKFKMQTSKLINKLQGTTGQPFWQRNYYEHVIRNNNELNRIREYIMNNPLNWDSDENNPYKFV